MKKYIRIFFVLILISALLNACTKDSAPATQPVKARTIHFELFTSSSFTTDFNMITFTLHIKSADNSIAWDSVLAPMRINQIPNEANKLEWEKTVPNDDGVKTLAVGFLYTIQNVGNSWYIDTCNAKDTLKTVSFDFK